MPELDPAAVIEAVTRDPRLRAFTGHGRIETLPARQARRHLLLDKIAQAFEPGVRWPLPWSPAGLTLTSANCRRSRTPYACALGTLHLAWRWSGGW
jgi:hypothetical protein